MPWTSAYLIWFFKEVEKGIVLIAQNSSWTNVYAGVRPQAFVLGPLLLSICASDFYKTFCWRSPLFSVSHDVKTSAKELHDYLQKANDKVFHCKMNFNPNPNKKPGKNFFSRKLKIPTHPPLVFNNNSVSQTFPQKILGAILNLKLTF